MVTKITYSGIGLPDSHVFWVRNSQAGIGFVWTKINATGLSFLEGPFDLILQDDCRYVFSGDWVFPFSFSWERYTEISGCPSEDMIGSDQGSGTAYVNLLAGMFNDPRLRLHHAMGVLLDTQIPGIGPGSLLELEFRNPILGESCAESYPVQQGLSYTVPCDIPEYFPYSMTATLESTDEGCPDCWDDITQITYNLDLPNELVWWQPITSFPMRWEKYTYRGYSAANGSYIFNPHVDPAPGFTIQGTWDREFYRLDEYGCPGELFNALYDQPTEWNVRFTRAGGSGTNYHQVLIHFGIGFGNQDGELNLVPDPYNRCGTSQLFGRYQADPVVNEGVCEYQYPATESRLYGTAVSEEV